MQTPPTEFSTYQNTLGGMTGAILHIDTGSGDFYYSTIPVTCTDAFIPDLLQPDWSIRENFEWKSKIWGVSVVTLNLLNARYKKTDGPDLWTTPGDELGGIRYADATLYLLCGTLAAPSSSIATLLSKCLTRYVGVVIEAPTYDMDKLTLRLVDILSATDAVLPLRTIQGSTDFPDALNTLTQKIPLVYGEFTYNDYNSDKTGFGLAKCIPTDARMPPRYFVVSDHPLKAFTELWAKDQALRDMAEYNLTGIVYDLLLDTDMSGYGYARAPEQVWIHLYPTNNAIADYDDLPPTAMETPEVVDRDPTTSYTIQNNLVVGVNPGTNPEGILIMTFDLEAFLVAAANFGDIFAFTNSLFDIVYWITDDPSTTTLQRRLRLYYQGNPDVYLDWAAGANGYYENTADTQLPISGKNVPYALALWVEGDDAEATGGTLDFCHLHEWYLRVGYTLREWEATWAECEGRIYGSWIGSRSSIYQVGYLIADPAGIIESILRDLLGLTSSNIDLTSFIDAENASVQARMNLHSDNEMLATLAIRQLAEQSTFAFAWTAAGKARLIPLNDSSPTTARTIPWSHIKNGDIKVGKTTDIIDEIQIKSRYLQEYGEYVDLDTVVDAGAEGVIYQAEWPNIAGTSVDHVAAHLVAASTGIWSNEHILIEFETILFTNADLELGDWIELDDASVDPHIKAYGASWSGKQLLVYDIEQTEDSTKIKAIELH